ncbi:AMP-binding protein [Nocardia vaccinii]|uniref:AMP-binding protein n=1 Tax=Nocardia vaccinii TaxID=1822 RepID=UPI000ABA802D|nr:AMP-binding protein [Nocardia vaccinii]
MFPFDNFATEIQRLADTFGSKVAVSSRERSLSFADLATRAFRVADALVATTAPDARVAILDKNSCEILEMFFGCSISGRVLVTLNWRLALDEMAAVLRHARPELCVVSREFLDLLSAAVDLAAIPCVVVPITDQPQGYEAWIDAAPAMKHPPVTNPDVVISQMYTSGTSGMPKGVLGTHRSVGAGLRSGDYCRYTDQSILLCAMPMFHIGGIQPALIALVRGGTVLLRREVDPVDLLETIEEHRVTHGFVVPTVIGMMMDSAETRTCDVSSIVGITYGASSITPSLLRRAVGLFGKNLIQVYGSTETCGAVCQLDPEDHHEDGPGQRLLRSAGKPYPWVEVRIADTVTGEAMSANGFGEVWLRSDQNTPGYVDDPEANAAAIDSEGWLHTGDGGYLDENGYLFLTDRIKDMIISGGENIYPAEVEAVIADHAAVASVAVIGAPDPKWGERIVAAVVAKQSATVTPDSIIEFCKQRLASYKCPKQVWLVTALPTTASGKILKRELRATVPQMTPTP